MLQSFYFTPQNSKILSFLWGVLCILCVLCILWQKKFNAPKFLFHSAKFFSVRRINAYCGKRNSMLQTLFFSVAYCGKQIPNLQSLFFNELRIVAQTKNYQRSEACLSLLRTVAKKWSTLQSLFINELRIVAKNYQCSKVWLSTMLRIVAETKSRSDAQLVANTIHQLSISSTKESNNFGTKCKTQKNTLKVQLKYLSFSKWWKILEWSSNNLLHGSFNAISRTEIRQSCVIYIIDSSEFRQKRNWKWRNLNFPISFDLFPAQSGKLLRLWWVIFPSYHSSQQNGNFLLDLKDFLFYWNPYPYPTHTNTKEWQGNQLVQQQKFQIKPTVVESWKWEGPNMSDLKISKVILHLL